MTDEIAQSLRVGDRVFTANSSQYLLSLKNVEAGLCTKHDLQINEMTVLLKYENEMIVRDINGRKHVIFNEKLHIERESATQMIEIALEQLVTDMTKNHKCDIDCLATFTEEVREDLYRSARERLASTRT